MSGSSFGALFRVTTWGESHGPAVGAVVDGCPAGLPLCEEDIQIFMDRRKPGAGRYATKRAESDTVSILSGVFEGRTTGTPISLMIKNADTRSKDYENIKNIYRNGHADYGYDAKYGFRDYRGGGRASGRETAGRVAAGAVAVKALGELGVSFLTYVKAIGGISVSGAEFDAGFINKNELYMPSEKAYKQAAAYLDGCMAKGDSAGGVVECIVTGVPAGIGSPVFDKLDACLARAVFSIGAVKAVEIGAGAAVSRMNGSECNDAFYADGGMIKKQTNNAGGITGGISDGAPIIIRAYFKPTPSVSVPQQTADRAGNNAEITVKGRHDPVIAPRACVVVETMAAAVIFDQMLAGMPGRMDTVKKAYGVLPSANA